MRWEHVATAPDQLIAEMWRELLQNEGIPAIIEPRDAVSFLGLSSTPCRLMVPEGSVKEALALLNEHKSG